MTTIHRYSDGVPSLYHPLDPATGIVWDSPSTGYNHTETQTVYVSGRDGQFLFVQLAHVNMGLGDNVQYTYQYVDTRTQRRVFRSGAIALSAFRLSDDRKSVTAGGISIQCAPGTLKYSVDVALIKEEVIHLEFEPAMSLGYRVGTGRAVFGDTPDASYISHEWLPRCRLLRATVSLAGDTAVMDMADGWALFVHANQRDRPFNLAARWQFAIFHSEHYTAHVCEFLPAGKYVPEAIPDGGEQDAEDARKYVRQGAVIRVGEATPMIITERVHGDVLRRQEKDPETGYSPPASLRYAFPAASAPSAVIQTDAVLVSKIDMLAELNWLARRLIQTFITRPYGYQGYNRADMVVTQADGTETRESGWIFNETTFMC